MNLKIEVHISTFGARIEDLQNRLPRVSNVVYKVIHQKHDDNQECFDFSYRSDIVYIPSNSIGVARSRNVGLMTADNDSIVLFSDDDVVYDSDLFSRLWDFFQNDSVTFCTFKVGLIGESTKTMLEYPDEKCKLKLSNIGKFGAVNLAVRQSFINSSGLMFDTLFGPGAKYSIGEDYIFIVDLLRNKAIGRYFPEILIYHHEENTGTINSKQLLFDRGPMFLRAHGLVLGFGVSVIFGLRKFGFLATLVILDGYFTRLIRGK